MRRTETATYAYLMMAGLLLSNALIFRTSTAQCSDDTSRQLLIWGLCALTLAAGDVVFRRISRRARA